MSSVDPRREIIASRLREARRMAGLSQAQAARLLGLHRPSVSEMEAGRRRVAAEELLQLAELYDVSVGWLGGERAEKLDAHADKLLLAARELGKLKPPDLERLMSLLASMQEQEL